MKGPRGIGGGVEGGGGHPVAPPPTTTGPSVKYSSCSTSGGERRKKVYIWRKKKDTFPGRSPDAAAVECLRRRGPATKETNAIRENVWVCVNTTLSYINNCLLSALSRGLQIHHNALTNSLHATGKTAPCSHWLASQLPMKLTCVTRQRCFLLVYVASVK